MKKKLTAVVVACSAAITCAFGLSACAGTHTHTYSDSWSSSETQHWHNAECEHTDEKSDVASHIDENNDGECDVCKYTPLTVKVDGTYYFCENDVTDDQLYITFKNGKWTDDENLTGSYSVSGNEIVLSMNIDGETVEFARGTVSGDDVTLDIAGAPTVYRKGEDIGSKPKEKTLSFALSEDKTYYIVKGIGGLTGEIEVPEEYKRKPVCEIAEKAFANCDALTKITLPDSVTQVGEKAFYKCTNLTEAHLGDSVKAIYASTFEGCKELQKVTLSAAVKKCEYDAFKDCNALTDIYFTGTAADWAAIEFEYSIGTKSQIATPLYATYLSSTGQKDIYRKLYVDGELLTAADLSNATAINPVCFYKYKYLESATIGGTAEEIGEYAFFNCQNLASLQFADGSLKAINQSAFSGTKIVSAILPDSVKIIEEGAFGSCYELTTVNTGSGASYIGEDAFAMCDKLANLTLGSSVAEICESAFYNCQSLESVTVPSSAIFIGKNAFSSTGLTSATFLSSTGWIANKNEELTSEQLSDTANAAKLLRTSVLNKGYADTDWEKPTLQYTLSNDGTYYIVNNNGTVSRSEIVIPEKYNEKPVRALASGAFSGCKSLKSISLPGCMLLIPTGAFSGCSSLESIEIRGSLVSDYKEVYASKDGMLYNADLTELLFIPSAKTELTITGVTEIANGAFAGNKNLKKVVVGAGVKTIGDYAFEGCKNLKSITISDSVTYVGVNAFADTAWYENQPDGIIYLGNVLYKHKGTWTGGKSLVVKDGTTGITKNAFSGCRDLEKITFPDSVAIIGQGALSGTAWYEDQPDGVIYAGKVLYSYKGYMPENTSITVKDGTKSITDSAFKYCSGLTSITIPNSVTSIGEFAFYECSGLTSITIPNSVTSISESAFYGCNGLTSITIPSGVTSIGASAFYDCSGLTSVNISDSVTSIGEYAFYNCSGLTSITIPESVTEIDNYAFSDCRCLTIYCEEASKPSGWKTYWNYNNSPVVWNCKNNDKDKDGYAYAIIGGIRYGLKDGEATVISQLKNITSINIPSSVTYEGTNYSVTTIRKNAFDYCYQLESITVDEDNSSYASYDGILYNKDKTEFIYVPMAISGEIVIPDSITSIGWETFKGRSKLMGVTIPDSVESIGGSAFKNCRDLTSITIGKGVKIINYSAFEGSGLTNITIPESVTSIDTSAFNECSGLTSITVDENNSFYASHDGVLYNKDKTEFRYVPQAISGTIVIPDGVSKIDKNRFKGRSGLTGVIIPESVTSIGDYAFYDCSGLTSIIIPNGVTYIGEYAFSFCTSLTSIVIPDSVFTIDRNAFICCGSLTSVTIGSNVGVIGDFAFENCSSLQSIIIPDSVHYIGERAFESCSSLTSIKIPDSITRIEWQMFKGCSSLTSVIIPESVTSIGSYTFNGCENLTSITFNGTKEQWIAISKGDGWDDYTGEYTIHCTDGDITKS